MSQCGCELCGSEGQLTVIYDGEDMLMCLVCKRDTGAQFPAEYQRVLELARGAYNTNVGQSMTAMQSNLQQSNATRLYEAQLAVLNRWKQ